MAERSFEKLARELSADFVGLRDDVRRLTTLVADLAGERADMARGRVADRADQARDRFSSTLDQTRDRLSSTLDGARDRFSDAADRFAAQASDVTGRVRGAGAELEARVERNPLTAVMIAVVGGLLIGAMSRSRR